MSLFQCHSCGCCENTALSSQGFSLLPEIYDWAGKEDLKGKRLCSACGPTKFSDGETVEGSGVWHKQFPRVFLAIGKWKTNRVGNLEHVETGVTDYRNHAIINE